MSDLRQPAPLPPRTSARPATPIRRMSPLARDIVVVLLVKALVLYGLWYAFFRAPVAPGMAMDPAAVEHRLLAPAPAVEPPRER